MYSDNPVINDLVLTIVNDGNGSQCGMSYAERCHFANDATTAHYRIACAVYARNRRDSGSSMATRREIDEAAEILQHYYREHVKEFK